MRSSTSSLAGQGSSRVVRQPSFTDVFPQASLEPSSAGARVARSFWSGSFAGRRIRCSQTTAVRDGHEMVDVTRSSDYRFGEKMLPVARLSLLDAVGNVASGFVTQHHQTKYINHRMQNCGRYETDSN